MKLIEALKQIKDLQRKADDIKKKVQQFSADLDFETVTYPDQKGQVSQWVQAYSDLIKEILSLRFRIQKTNLQTLVTVQLGDNSVKKTIAEWIHRRKDLAKLEAGIWGALTDRGLKEGKAPQTNGTVLEIKIRRYYDPIERDKKLEVLSAEPSLIDGALEIANATTDLME